MASRRKRLEAIGQAVISGRADAIQARVVGSVAVDPNKHITLEGQQCVGTDFTGRRLDSFHAINSRFLRCSFRDIQIDDACWGAGKNQSHYVECCFDGARFRSVAPGNARFVNCSFRNAHVLEFYAFSVELIDCVFSGRIDHGFLNGTRDRTRITFWDRLLGRTRNEISDNDFSRCDLKDFAFRTGVDLTGQKLPIGSKYLYLPDAAAALERGRRAIWSWADDETRRLATILLDIMAKDLSVGQKQQFFQLPNRGQFAVAWERLRVVLADNAPNL
jgi:uncharacterized protein YjbI with pentapeptide repeats